MYVIGGEFEQGLDRLFAQAYENHYLHSKVNSQDGGALPHVFYQHGGVLPIVWYEQGGSGFGSIFRAGWNLLKPLFVSGAKAVGKQALSSVGSLLGDVVSGANFADAGQIRLNEAGRNLGDKLSRKLIKTSDEMPGSGFGNKRGVHLAKLASLVSPAQVKGSRKRRSSRISGKKKKTYQEGSGKRRRRTSARKKCKVSKKKKSYQCGSGLEQFFN